MEFQADARPAARVAKGSSFLIAQNLVALVAGLAYIGFAARLLPSVEDFGRVATLTMLHSLASIIASIALPTAVTRFVADAIGRGREGDAQAIFGKALLVGSIASIVAATIFYVGAQEIAQTFLGGIQYSALIKLLALDVFLQSMSPYFSGMLQGLQKFRDISVAGTLTGLTRYAGAIILLERGWGIQGIVLSWIVGDGIGFLYSALVVLMSSGVPRTSYPLGPLVKFSAPLFANSIISYSLDNIDRYIVLALAGQGALGIYAPAIAAAGVINFVSASVSSALLPTLSEFFGGAGTQAVIPAVKLATRYIYFLYTPLAFGLVGLSTVAITLLVGDRYSAAALPLAILAIASSITSASSFFGNTLLAFGKTGDILKASLVSVMVDLALALTFIAFLGTTGAALARGGMFVTSFFVLGLASRRGGVLPLDIGALIKTHLSATLMAAVVFLFQMALPRVELLPLYVVVGGLVYLVGLRLLRAVRTTDLQLIRAILPRRLGWIVDLASKLLV